MIFQAMLRLKARYGTLNAALVALSLRVDPDVKSINGLAAKLGLSRTAIRGALGRLSKKDSSKQQ